MNQAEHSGFHGNKKRKKEKKRANLSQLLWNKIVSLYSNVSMVLCGSFSPFHNLELAIESWKESGSFWSSSGNN